MNTFLKAAVLSVSTALVATSVFAAPQDHQPNKNPQVNQTHGPQAPMPPQHQAQKPQHPNNQGTPPKHQQQAQQKVNPSRDWKVGQKVPNQYLSHSYKVDYKQSKKMTKPAKNQEWIKVNGDYILKNDSNHKIIKIIRG